MPALTCRHAGLAHGDASASPAAGLATAATGAGVVGTYPVTQGALAATGNYTSGTFHQGALTVNPASLTVTADKKGRNVCLIPEATGVIQELYREQWERTLPKPIRLFYITRCYRYERPQAGRYREFTQVGVEVLGPDASKGEAVAVLRKCLDEFGLSYTFVLAVKRGLTYYVEDGFEVECDQLGAQKQVAGGGRYREGIGWAIGLDRLLLALNPRAEGAT